MKTAILPIDSPTRFQQAMDRAAALLKAGEVVALPTETVYGVAANAFDQQALARVFEIKGRPAHNPVIVHVASIDMARKCVSHWPETAARLSAAFWPGPLTLVLPRAPSIPDIVTAGGPTVGVRWPEHRFTQELIRACGFPLAMPSANPAGNTSPTTAGHVLKGLGGKIPLIVDGGASLVGIESTVLDLSGQTPRVLRPGMIQAEALQAILGRASEVSPKAEPFSTDGALRSPGQLPRHYAPKARLVVLEWRDEADLKSQISNLKFEIPATHIIAHSRVPSGGGFGRVVGLPREPEAYARGLYAELHQSDDEGAQLIVVESGPLEAGWQGIADRLRRAATR